MKEEKVSQESVKVDDGFKKEESSNNLWLPEIISEEIIGKIISIDEVSFGEDKSKSYLIKTNDGKMVRTPSHRVLLNRLAAGEFKEGNEIKIVYTGTEPPTVKGNKPTKMYDVFNK